MRALNITKQLSVFILILNIFSNSVAFAQKSKGTTPVSAPKCSGAWTGIITYTRTQSSSNSKTVERVSGRGQDTTTFEMKYDYKASMAVVEAPEKNGSSNGIATINHNFTSSEKVVGKEKNSCDRGKSWQEMSGTSVSKTQITGQGKENANVSIGVNSDGTYSVSVGLPQIQGRITGSTSSTFSGQCTPKEGKSYNMPATATSVDGNSLTSDGANRVNPDDPNRLSGSYSKTWQNVIETITWNLQKCGAPLRLTDLKFEHPKFPDFNNWQEIVEQTGTIDGNMVKVKAKVLNASGETKSAVVKLSETYKGDKWDGARPDAPLGEGEMEITLDPGEEKEVEMIWDSSGYAWFDDGRPRLVQRIKADLEENGKKTDSMTKNLKVAPKPLVLVHDLWSSWKTFEVWQNILTTSHSYDWKAFPVGEVTNKGIINTGREFLSPEQTNTTEDNAAALASYIKYAQEDRNAWHVDIVAHGLGGIISRYYISRLMPMNSPDGRPKVSHLVMLGTPNEGTKCANVLDTTFGVFDENMRAIKQLRTSVMAEFNRTDTRKGVRMSVLAGDPLPVMCYSTEWNDGFVSVPSAFHNFADTKTTKSIHTELTGTKDFSDFVKPHLAIGPKGNHDPDNTPYTEQGGDGLYRSGESFLANVVYQRGGEMKPEIFFGQGTTIAAKQTVEMEITIPANTDGFGLTFLASPLVSATLVDAAGNVLGKNLKGMPEAGGMFRTIVVAKDLSGTTVKLKLLSDEKLEATAIVSVWKKPDNPKN
jgi:pimeloyl-ACP methyl ester carboxylesterase